MYILSIQIQYTADSRNEMQQIITGESNNLFDYVQ